MQSPMSLNGKQKLKDLATIYNFLSVELRLIIKRADRENFSKSLNLLLVNIEVTSEIGIHRGVIYPLNRILLHHCQELALFLEATANTLRVDCTLTHSEWSAGSKY